MTTMHLMDTADPSADGTYLPIEDSRHHRRFPALMRVRLGQHDIRACRGNVSAGGFCFEWFMPVPEGTAVELTINLPGLGNRIGVRGEVLGCTKRGGRIGVRGRFTRIHPLHRQLLIAWSLYSGFRRRVA